MNKTISYVISNGIMVGSVYFGMFKGNDGALNIAVFYGWFVSVMAIFFSLALTKKDIAKKSALQYKGGSGIPRWFDAILDVSITLAMIYKGYFWLSGFYLFHTVLLHSAKEKLIKVKKWLSENDYESELPEVCNKCSEYHSAEAEC